jgi:hypothetical protein
MLADHYSEDWETLWRVRANGRATIPAGPRQTAGPLRLRANRHWPYRQRARAGPVLVVTVERRTGRAGTG